MINVLDYLNLKTESALQYVIVMHISGNQDIHKKLVKPLWIIFDGLCTYLSCKTLNAEKLEK